MTIEHAGAASFSDRVMTFDLDEISAGQLIDPFVRRSELSDIGTDVSVIYSPNRDVALSVNGQFARGEVRANPMTNWYGIDTGITYHKSGNKEPDGIKTAIFSKSEKCYYLGTTEGLYRTYNDDFSGCERILSSKIIAQGSELSAAEKEAHVTNVAEIGAGVYVVSVTGKTNATVKYCVYDSAKDALFENKMYATNSGWKMANRVIKSDDRQAVVAFTGTDENTIIDVVVVDKQAQKITAVRKIPCPGLAANEMATHFMEQLGDRMFFSHHYSDNPGGKKYTGLSYTALSNITNSAEAAGDQSFAWTSDMISIVPELAGCRVYQIRTAKDALYACCGLSGTDPLGLFEIRDEGGQVTCRSLSGDQYLSGFQEAKDVYYSEKAGKWAFCLLSDVYVADDVDGRWGELTATGYSVGDEGYPRFNEFDSLATIYARFGNEETMLESPTTAGGLVALLSDIKTRNIKVDGMAVDPDEHGFVDLRVTDMIENHFQVVDEIPANMADGVVYLVRKRG